MHGEKAVRVLSNGEKFARLDVRSNCIKKAINQYYYFMRADIAGNGRLQNKLGYQRHCGRESMIGDGINWQVYWTPETNIGTNIFDCIPRDQHRIW